MFAENSIFWCSTENNMTYIICVGFLAVFLESVPKWTVSYNMDRILWDCSLWNTFKENSKKTLRILNSQKSKNQAEKCEFDKNEWNTLSQFLIDPILVCCIRSLRVRVNPLTSQSSLTLGLTKFDYRVKMSYSHYAAFSYTFE